MAPEESKQQLELLTILEESRQEFHKAVEGLEEAHASLRPAPERWSVLECMEHVVNVEHRFLGRLQSAERVETPAIDKAREDALRERVVNRSQRAEAPEMVRPSGRFRNLPEALEAFDAARADMARFVEAHHPEIYLLVSSHARFGTLNGYEYVLIAAGHSSRHAAQIREIRAAVANP
jgi:uncharacterized damage-inducible protein DinB